MMSTQYGISTKTRISARELAPADGERVGERISEDEGADRGDAAVFTVVSITLV